MFLFPWYAALCAAQGLLVAAPAVGREAGRRHALLGLAGPAAAMIVGVGLDPRAGRVRRELPGLPRARSRRPPWRPRSGARRTGPGPYLTVVAAAVLYVVAWQASGHVAEVAGALLIGGACLAIASIVGPITPARYLAIGLIVLIGVDVYLVWGTTQVKATSVALQNATLPHIGVTHRSRPLPALQQVDLGNSSMGWLDFLAPALLGAVVGPAHPPPSRWPPPTVAVTALAWGFLLEVTSPIPATVPVLAGLASPGRLWWRRE